MAAILREPEPAEEGWQDTRKQHARSTCSGAGTLAADLSTYSTGAFDRVEHHRRLGPKDRPKLIDEDRKIRSRAAIPA